MLEWYEAYADYGDTMERIERLVARVAEETLGTTDVTFRGHELDLAPLAALSSSTRSPSTASGSRDEAELRARSRARHRRRTHDKTWAQLVDHALSHFVEPPLIQPTILYDYPIELSPFARTTDDEAIVERFEYFVGGMELGNAFTEINDSRGAGGAVRLQADEGAGGNVEAEPGDPDYVEALSYGMPPTGGLGLGIDRLAMLLSARTRSAT